MIELWIEGNKIELEAKEKIALTYQLSKLGDLENRKTNMTSGFTIPFSFNNVKYMGYLNVPESASEIPYTKLSAKLKVNGLEVVSEGYAVIDDITKKGFETNVYWGNFDLFSIIKERKLSDLDLSTYDDIWLPATKLNYITALTGLVYPLIDWHKDSPNAGMLENGVVLVSYNVYPAFYLATLFNEILEQAGFTYEILFDKLTDFNNKIIPLVTRKSDANLDANCEVEYADVRVDDYILTQNVDNQLDLMTKVIDKFDLVSKPSAFQEYIIPSDGLYSFEYSINGRAANVEDPILDYVELKIESTKSTALTSIYQIATNATYTTVMTDVQFNKGDIVYYSLLLRSHTDCQFYLNGLHSFKCTKAELKQTEPNVDYPVAANLPDMSQSELVKFVMQRYGLFCSITESHVTFFSIDTIVANKSKAINLNDKIVSEVRMFDSKKPSIDGFGQRNIWSYAKDEVDNSGYVECNNTNLEKEVKIYTAPFTECNDVIRLNGTKMAQIKRLEQAGTPLVATYKNEVKAKILSSYLLTKDFGWYVSGGGSTIHSIIVGVFDDVVNVDSCDTQKSLDTNYIALKNILTNPSSIKIKINCSIIDFININPMIPYFIWNEYYLLNEVPSYINNELTELQLIKI